MEVRRILVEKERGERRKSKKLVVKFLFPAAISTKQERAFSRMVYPSMCGFHKLRFEFQLFIVKEILRMFLFSFDRVYLDESGWKLESRNNYKKSRRLFKNHVAEYVEYYIDCRIIPFDTNVYIHEPTARSFQRRASVNEQTGLLTGVFTAGDILEYPVAVVAGHLVDGVGSIVDISGGIRAKCVSKEAQITDHDDQLYTADVALLEILEQGSSNSDLDKVEMDGKLYERRLHRAGIGVLLPDTEVWMYDQNGEIKKGLIVKFMLSDHVLNLYNVVQIKPKNGGCFSDKGDSGGCVFFPPTTNSDTVYVFGMVVSRLPEVNLTNVIIFENVLPCMIKNFVRGMSPKKPLGPNYGMEVFKALEFVGSVNSIDLFGGDCSGGAIDSSELDPGENWVRAASVTVGVAESLNSGGGSTGGSRI